MLCPSYGFVTVRLFHVSMVVLFLFSTLSAAAGLRKPAVAGAAPAARFAQRSHLCGAGLGQSAGSGGVLHVGVGRTPGPVWGAASRRGESRGLAHVR